MSESSALSRRIFLSILTLLVVVLDVSIAESAVRKRSKKVRYVDSSLISYTNVTIKKKIWTIQCLGNKTPGFAKTKKGKLTFNSFSSLISSSTNGKKEAQYRSLKSAGAKACKSKTNPPTPGMPDSPNRGAPVQPLPDHLSLDPYTGPFGEDEARILYNRFAFGGRTQDIYNAVQSGLGATINKLTTFVPEPNLDAIEKDIRCDGWITGDPNAGTGNRQCNPNNPNDLSSFGIRTGWVYRIVHTENPFFERFAFFLHDERMSVASSAARDCERHAVVSYVEALRHAARSGDYAVYLRSMYSSHLLHLRWLDGAANLGGISINRPNENFAREFWELGSVGPTDLNGNPVYSDLDIAQASLGFTGWMINSTTVNNFNVCLASPTPLLHTGGTKTIFIGTPYQATIDTAGKLENASEDILQASLRHPRTAEHLAEDIWKQFINDAATPDAIRALATIIRENNYNLVPVFRRVMSSKAVFAAGSRNTLLKHPIERVVGWLKLSGFPTNYRSYDELLNRLEQRPLDPPSVFGWNEYHLADDARLLAWRNVVIDYFMNINPEDVKEDYNWSYYDRFVLPLHNAGVRSARDVVRVVSKELGVNLTDSQINTAEYHMNYELSSWNCPSGCNGQAYRMYRNLFDTSPDADGSQADWNGQKAIRMFIASILTMPEYLTK